MTRCVTLCKIIRSWKLSNPKETDSLSVILYDFKENIPGFSDIKKQRNKFMIIIPCLCWFIRIFGLKEPIVLIVADFLFFFKIFRSENGQKIPCRFETGRGNTILCCSIQKRNQLSNSQILRLHNTLFF